MRNVNFTVKVQGCFLGVSLLLLLTTAVVMIPQMRDLLQDNYHETMELTLNMTSQNIENTLDYYEETAYQISGSDELNQWLLDETEPDTRHRTEWINSFLSTNAIGNHHIRSVVVSSVKGGLYFYSRYNELGVTYLSSLISPEEYLAAYGDSPFRWTYDATLLPLTQAESRESRILLTGIIKNRSEVYKNEAIATFLIEYDVNILLQLYHAADFDGLGNIQVWDMEEPVYPVIQQHKKTVDPALRSAVEKAVSGENSQILEWNNALISTRTIQSTGWELVGIVDEGGIHSKVEKIQWDVFFVLALELVMAAALSLTLSFQVTQPIKQLISYMKQVENGDLTVQIPARRRDEFGQLSMQFNRMVEQLDDLIHEVYEVKASEREAQITAMRAQMNPHFLYNTLGAISWTVNLGKNEDACEMIACLGDILRYSIKGAEFVTVRDEVQQASNYLYLQKKRMGSMLQYHIELSDEILECKVLKFFLQPIVENAILHGISGCGHPGEITISAQVVGDDLQISILDNGQGIDPARIGTILSEKVAEGDHAGIGLSNVNKRIKLIYGEERYGVRIESASWGTRVMVTLPLQF